MRALPTATSSSTPRMLTTWATTTGLTPTDVVAIASSANGGPPPSTSSSARSVASPRILRRAEVAAGPLADPLNCSPFQVKVTVTVVLGPSGYSLIEVMIGRSASLRFFSSPS